ncbi:caspase family protein [Bradyrhizobium sp. HKCCYLR20261]|uniref:caspase family protein n=1 Tax=Bradyrhizobium sp. HKCCYLR20261 TaxID=3420760 RepID=UPI003EBA2C50
MSSPVDPALIFEDASPGPGTHAIVIGIGHYDAVAAESIAAAGLEQLAAPPLSARALVTWFLDHFDNPGRPLKSVSLVLSEGETARPFSHARTIPGARPTIGAVSDVVPAIRAWLKRASSHSDNLAIFFFSGHGVSTGEPILLLRDYGIDPENRFDGAINFNRFAAAMKTKLPTHQVFFIDACQNPDPLAFSPDAAHREVGLACIEATTYGPVNAQQSVHHSTSDLTVAYARTSGLSLFTDALIQGLNGGGAQSGTEWYVSTLGLQSVLSHQIERLARKLNIVQVPHAARCYQIPIHKPAAINVPLYVRCDPTAAMKNACIEILGVVPRNYYDSDEHEPTEEWMTVLSRGEYKVRATFKDHLGYREDESVSMVVPPEAICRIKCRPR